MNTQENTIAEIATELKLPAKQVAAAVSLLQDGNTIPFIARYRKEATQSLNEIQLRQIEDALERINALAARKLTVIKSIKEQDLMTPALQKAIDDCRDLASLEVIYLPFKPKRRTRATIARERGLQPLADVLSAQSRIGQTKTAVLKPYIDSANDLPDADAVLAGGLDIVAEQWSEDVDTRQWLLEKAQKFGRVVSKVKRGKKTAEGADKFEQYFEREESVSRIPGHRVLAMLRGSGEGILRVGLAFEGDREVSDLKRRLVTNREFEFFHDLNTAAEDCFARLLMPATESAILQQLKARRRRSSDRRVCQEPREVTDGRSGGPESYHRHRPRLSYRMQSCGDRCDGEVFAERHDLPNGSQERHPRCWANIAQADPKVQRGTNRDRQWYCFARNRRVCWQADQRKSTIRLQRDG